MANIHSDENGPAQPLGIHIIADLYDCEHPGILDNVNALRELFEDAATQAGASVLGSRCEKFIPQGASGVVLIAESHLSFHTWPEHNFVSLDVFTCGDRVMPDDALQIILDHLKPAHIEVTTLQRGGQHGATDAE